MPKKYTVNGKELDEEQYKQYQRNKEVYSSNQAVGATHLNQNQQDLLPQSVLDRDKPADVPVVPQQIDKNAIMSKISDKQRDKLMTLAKESGVTGSEFLLMNIPKKIKDLFAPSAEKGAERRMSVFGTESKIPPILAAGAIAATGGIASGLAAPAAAAAPAIAAGAEQLTAKAAPAAATAASRAAPSAVNSLSGFADDALQAIMKDTGIPLEEARRLPAWAMDAEYGLTAEELSVVASDATGKLAAEAEAIIPTAVEQSVVKSNILSTALNKIISHPKTTLFTLGTGYGINKVHSEAQKIVKQKVEVLNENLKLMESGQMRYSDAQAEFDQAAIDIDRAEAFSKAVSKFTPLTFLTGGSSALEYYKTVRDDQLPQIQFAMDQTAQINIARYGRA